MRRCPTHGLAGTLATNGVDLVRPISAITGGTSWPLYAPLVMADARTAGSLAGDSQIQETSAQRSKVSCAIVSIGAWAPDAFQVYMSLRDADATQLQAAGVCAETCALVLDANGYQVHGLDERRMGISEGNLRVIPAVIAVTTGPEKMPVYEGRAAPSPPRDPASASAPSGADQCSDSGRDGLWRSAIRSHCDDTHRTMTRLATEPLPVLRSVFQLAAGSGWASAVTTAV